MTSQSAKENSMKYFRLNFNDATRAKQEVWRRQIESDQEDLTTFNESTRGMDSSVWTDDPHGEQLFRKVLNEMNIPHEEGNEQQVVTGW
jgi:hypothetical protein